MPDQWDIIIVGGGGAGFTAARSARRTDPRARILLISDEDREPYDRTELSKHLSNGFERDSFRLEPPEWYKENDIALVTGSRVTALDPDGHSVATNAGESYRYGRLVLAPGAVPEFPKNVRKHEEGSFRLVRSAGEAENLVRDAKKARRVLVAGMGVLGVEIVWQLSSMGKEVTMVGATPQLMPRQLNTRAGEILEDLLTRSKVRLFFQEEILSFEKHKKGGWEVSMIKHSGVYDLVVFCIGVLPRIDLARDAGLSVNQGIAVDERLATSVPDVFAAGDAAEHPDGTITCLWKAAEYQGDIAGANAAGGNATFDNPPFRLKTEVFGSYFFSVNKPGDPLAYDIDEVEKGDVYSCLYYDQGRLAGVVMVNDNDNADNYLRAVRESWDRPRVEKQIVT